LVLKYGEDSIAGVARVKLGSKWMGSEILASLVLVFLGGSIEYGWESGGGDGCMADCGHNATG
jgi:hypothetical protein